MGDHTVVPSRQNSLASSRPACPSSSHTSCPYLTLLLPCTSVSRLDTISVSATPPTVWASRHPWLPLATAASLFGITLAFCRPFLLAFHHYFCLPTTCPLALPLTSGLQMPLPCLHTTFPSPALVLGLPFAPGPSLPTTA